MKKAVIETTVYVTVYPGDEYDGEEMSGMDASGWMSHALSRGDKHTGQYYTSFGPITSVTYEDYDEDE
ncbi:hypothetical protein ACGFZB_28795 [Streptomyces cinerochromogenes]|uniref:Uncharacterized protein n=1 Tax=Streptomyces cinerochromogenes TaxID=66422 RepID=A0ABW7BE82_9ACTN